MALQRAKVAHILKGAIHALVHDVSSDTVCAVEIWNRIACDAFFKQRVTLSQRGLPEWKEVCNTVYPIVQMEKPYQIVGVDGSQIYPDKHQGTSCFLINIGFIELSYGLDQAVFFDSIPYLFTHAYDCEEQGISGIDRVNGKREAFELQMGYDRLNQLVIKKKDVISACMFDGSFVFWHLSGKDAAFKDYFLKQYCDALDRYAQDAHIVFGYMSYPRNRELVHVVQLYAQLYPSYKGVSFDHIVDTTFLASFLQEGQRTIVFYNQSPVVFEYPVHVRPCFVYAHMGSEIVRIEFPAYVVDSGQVDLLCSLAYDQAQKGLGYPVCLAEAHEQAVVTASDREFFYQMIYKISVESNKHVSMSQKLQKKRTLAV